MSWEAVAWANRQRMRLPQEQLVLLVLANCADPDGCAFARWRGHEHWWNYIRERTRLSKASVFRHLKTIETLGLGIRTDIELADGTRRPVMHLDLEKTVDQNAEYEETGTIEGTPSQSHGETETARNQSHGETGASLTVRLDQSHGETGDNISSLEIPIRDSKPPNPPTGGGQEFDPDFEDQIAEAQRLYPIPITNLPRFRAIWATIEKPRRPKILSAMRGFASFIADCERKGKPRAVKDADRWVASGMWEGYAAAGQKADNNELKQTVAEDSAEGQAWRILHRIARIEPKAFAGKYLLPGPMTPQLLTLSGAPPLDNWHFIPEAERQQTGAWNNYLRKMLGERARPALVDERNWRGSERINERGFLAPWAWPPRVDGSLSTGPPEADVA